MKAPVRLLPLLLCLPLLLSGCGRWVEDQVYYVAPHVEQTLPTVADAQEETVPLVTNRTELRGAVLSLIRDWTELGHIDVENYDGDIAADLAETLHYATREDPTGAYAVDYADAQLSGDGLRGRITVSIVFRRSAAEIDAIVTVSGNAAAQQRIQQALSSLDTALTLRVRNYREEDFVAFIRQYCLFNPATVTVLPEISVAVYPDSGATRILELHFGYPCSRDELRQMQQSVGTILASASSYVRSGSTDESRVRLLYRFLSTRFSYSLSEELPQVPAYELLCDGVAHSLSFASVFYSECQSAEVRCWLVEGSLNGRSHWWNLVEIDGSIWHVDVMRSILFGELSPRLLPSSQLRLEGYRWDESLYPQSAEPPESSTEPGPSTEEPTESTEPTEPPEESTRPSQPPEPTESTEAGTTGPEEPTESTQEQPSGSEEGTEPTEPTEPTESGSSQEPTEEPTEPEPTEPAP